ncbi:MAG: single-stranded-DNA-specific exonuclease RecJ, partial [Spirochaetes bacterium RBG_16_67_19]
MRWEKTELDPGAVREAARRYGLDLISASILLRRGLASDSSLPFVLDADLARLHNPFLLEDMDKAVERILAAARAGEKVHVFGDSDVDGITSTVLLVQTLAGLGLEAGWQLPEGDQDYGLSRQAVEELAGAGCGLLITVDCGIGNAAEIELARQRGIQTIVLDHHNPPEILPDALALIDPKLRGTRYPFRDLAGCGVVAKLALALAIARTPLYGQDLWLLATRPANAVLSLEALHLVNLAPLERIADSVPQGGYERSRVARALAGRRVLVLQGEEEAANLARAAADPGFALEDIQPLLREVLPEQAGKSLLRLRESWPPARLDGSSELDTLAGLYTRACWRKHGLAQSLEPVLDLAALGTIADLMPLTDENRLLVRRGLEVMNRLGRAGLRELLIRQNLHGRRLTVRDVSWQLTPVLNSAGRMGDPAKAARLFLSSDPREIHELIEGVLELNARRKSLGDRAWERCQSQAYQSLSRSGQKLVYVADPSVPRGITGLLASRLSGFFKVPVLAVAAGQEKAVGSLRSPFSMEGFLDRFADLLTNYGGHDCAAGFTMASEELPRFEARLFLLARDFQPPAQEESHLRIDAEVPPAYLNPELIRVVELFEPFGEASPPVTLLTRGARIESLEIVGRKEAAHVRLLLAADRYKWPAVYWNAAERAGKDFAPGDTVDVVYRLGRNYFQNTESLQLTVLDLKR